MEGEFEKRIVKQLNIETKNFSLAQHDKVIVLDYFRKLVGEAKKDFPHLLLRRGNAVDRLKIFEWYEKWFGNE